MFYFILISSLVLIMVVFALYIYYFTQDKKNNTSSKNNATGTEAYKDITFPRTIYVYKLWIDYCHWITLTFLAIYQRDPIYDYYSAKLDVVAEQLGKDFSITHGEELGKKYEDLLKEHMGLCKRIMTELNEGNSISAYYKEWVENGDKLSGFISTSNPSLSQHRIGLMWETILTNILNQAKALITNQSSSFISYAELVEVQIIAFVSYLFDFSSK